MWGASRNASARSPPRRFIPTCVGSIDHKRSILMTSKVHPHVCGEHWARTWIPKWRPGSSPRVWGACRTARRYVPADRFIPTCVGSIWHPSHRRRHPQVHPHVCGEHVASPRERDGILGSSPRVWGAFLTRRHPSGRNRFIPTCVGSMPSESIMPPQSKVHPHVCGEHVNCHATLKRVTGSSPRVWGASDRAFDYCQTTRFIPTCVGSIHSHPPPAPCHPVHPHVCGEHDLRSSVRRNRKGSSPRVWGAFFEEVENASV